VQRITNATQTNAAGSLFWRKAMEH
jgi:hypothetical protein